MVRDLTTTPIFQFLKLIKVLVISRDPRLVPLTMMIQPLIL